jgi:hypothetical protein
MHVEETATKAISDFLELAPVQELQVSDFV